MIRIEFLNSLKNYLEILQGNWTALIQNAKVRKMKKDLGIVPDLK